MFKCGSSHKGDKQYWKTLYENVYNRDKLNHLFSWLLHRDIKKWCPVDDRPKTKAYNIAISNAIPTNIRWLKELTDKNYELYEDKEGYCINTKRDKNGNEYIFGTAGEIYKCFNYWAVKHHLLQEGQFKSLPFKKLLQDTEGITFDKFVKYNGQSKRVVFIDVKKLTKQLEKYNFSVSEEEEEELDLDDMEDVNCEYVMD